MKLDKFAYLYSKPLGNHTLKVMKKIPGNLLKKPGNIMEFCQSEKVGTLRSCSWNSDQNYTKLCQGVVGVQGVDGYRVTGGGGGVYLI